MDTPARPSGSFPWLQAKLPFRANLIVGGIVLLLAATLRFYHIGTNPPGLFRDEADKGYTAYSLLRTGRDLEGSLWPLSIRSLRVYTSPVYQWAAIPFVALGGLREWVIRAPAALAGTLTVLLLFPATRGKLGDGTAWTACLFLAASPWHLPFSRWANQGILVPLFALAGLWLVQAGLAQASRKRLFLAGLAFFFAAFSYAPAQLFIPLLLIWLWVQSRWEQPPVPVKIWIPLLAGLMLLAVPCGIHLLFTWETGGRRFDAVSVFSQSPGILGGILQVGRNFLLHLDPRFLFLQGDANLRHSLPGWGMLLPVQAVLLPLGILSVRRRTLGGFEGLWLGWFLLALIPASLTAEGIPHGLRTIVVHPSAAVLCALGLRTVAGLSDTLPGSPRWKRLPPLFLLLWWAGSVFAVEHHYFVRYPRESALYWEVGYREAVNAVVRHARPEEPVWISALSEYPEIHFYFHAKVPPAAVQDGENPLHLHLLSHPQDPASGPAWESGLALLRPWENPGLPPLETVIAPGGEPVWVLVRRP